MRTTKLEDLRPCPNCGEQHLPCGGLSFADRIRTAQISEALRPTATRRSYYDDDALTEQFGENRKERKARLERETEGMGYAKTIGGKTYVRDRKTRDVREASPQELDRAYLSGPDTSE
jgi:hypothetical protein